MADLRSIPYPAHLDNPSIAAHELIRMASTMSPEQLALAKELNIMGNKIDWMMRQYVDDRNVLVEHDRIITSHNRIYWLGGILLLPGNFWMLAKLFGWV